MTYAVTPTYEAATVGAGLRLSTIGAMASNLRVPVGRMPVSIPVDQVYYWSYRWQESERKARDDLKNGRSGVFADPTDAVRHLLG